MSFENLENLKPGSLVFTTGIYSPLSFGIRKFLDFKYSHVAIYVGCGEIIESDWGGIVISPLEKYFENRWYRSEIVDTNLSLEQFERLSLFAKGKLQEDYDYTVLAGYICSKIFKRSRQMKALWNTTTGWTCSEFAASCYSHVGVAFGLPLAQITPKDLYRRFTA